MVFLQQLQTEEEEDEPESFDETGVDEQKKPKLDSAELVENPKPIRSVIMKMIQTSELDPVISIRQDESALEELQRRLSRLVMETKLDPEQLESFLGSLCNPVHLTQGPPGTGKSYLGVVIIRALLMIRRLWIQLHPEVGNPPILVNIAARNCCIFICEI